MADRRWNTWFEIDKNCGVMKVAGMQLCLPLALMKISDVLIICLQEPRGVSCLKTHVVHCKYVYWESAGKSLSLFSEPPLSNYGIENRIDPLSVL